MSENIFTDDLFETASMKEDMKSINKNYGKFKDASKLYEAYNNLEKEFTKKCQELGEFKKNQKLDNVNDDCQSSPLKNEIINRDHKQIENISSLNRINVNDELDNKNQNGFSQIFNGEKNNSIVSQIDKATSEQCHKDGEIEKGVNSQKINKNESDISVKNDDKFVRDKSSQYENVVKENKLSKDNCRDESESSKRSVEQDENPPLNLYGYEKENWNEQVKGFLVTHKDALSFSKEIGQVLIEDKDLASLPNSLELAYNKVLAEKFIPYEKLMVDEDFLNKYIYSNQQIVKTIISKYLKNINENKYAPIIFGKTGSSVGLVKDSVYNLDDAKDLLSKMLMQK